MTTLTIELPDDLAAELLPIPEVERNRYAITLLRRGLDSLSDANEEMVSYAEEEQGRYWQSLTLEEQEASRAALARALADVDAGRVSPGDEVFARIRARHAEKQNTQ